MRGRSFQWPAAASGWEGILAGRLADLAANLRLPGPAAHLWNAETFPIVAFGPGDFASGVPWRALYSNRPRLAECGALEIAKLQPAGRVF